jgi:hypothetical protein
MSFLVLTAWSFLSASSTVSCYKRPFSNNCVEKDELYTSMPLSHDELPLTLKGNLTADETARCVAYALQMPVTAGTKLEFPRIRIDVPWEDIPGFC